MDRSKQHNPPLKNPDKSGRDEKRDTRTKKRTRDEIRKDTTHRPGHAK